MTWTARLIWSLCAGAAAQVMGGAAWAEDAAGASDCLAGAYDGGQTEVAAGIELGADGRFYYGLSYGALDERAQGRWRADSGHVYLTSDPVKEPAFILLSERPSRDRGYHIRLDLPQGMSAQYFDAEINLADGRVIQKQLAEDGLSYDFGKADKPVTVRLHLPIFSLASPAFPVTGARSAELRFRFDPNDLGKVAFDDAPLKRDGADLLLERYDRTLRFRPEQGGCGKPDQP